MKCVQTLAAALLVALATATDGIDSAVEPQDLRVTSFFEAVVVTSVSDKRNYANPYTQPICVTDVTRVRQAMYNDTRDLYIEVKGCSLETPRGLCGPTNCQPLPFEVNVVGPATTPGFDPEAAMRQGKPVKSPYAVRSIGLLL